MRLVFLKLYVSKYTHDTWKNHSAGKGYLKKNFDKIIFMKKVYDFMNQSKLYQSVVFSVNSVYTYKEALNVSRS